MKFVIPVALIAAVLVVLGIVGEMDYQDALAEEANYCKMVREGAWPDYEGVYEKVCKKYELVVDSEAPSN